MTTDLKAKTIVSSTTREETIIATTDSTQLLIQWRFIETVTR